MQNGKGTGESYRQMRCGFALAILLPEQRTEELLIHENELMGYRAAYWASTHPYLKMRALARKGPRFLQRVCRKILSL